MSARDVPQERSKGGPRSALEAWDGRTYQDVLTGDGQDVPDFMRTTHVRDLNVPAVSASRYTSQEFFNLEVEKVWLRAWQFACHETDIPNAGDTYIYEIAGHSVIVVRQVDGGLRAFRNVCLHRGRRLVQEGGCKRHLRCPYHGFTWGIDGRLEKIPAEWDFPQIPDDFPLLPVKVEAWAGFAFISFDPHVAPLADVLGPIPEHFEHWKIADCYKAAHVCKVVNANWKAVAEAFLEAHHVAATHPQMVAYSMDANYQCDVLTDHVTRMMGAAGEAGVLADNIPGGQDEVVRAMFASGSRAGGVRPIEYAAGMSARRYAADISRMVLSELTGLDLSQCADADVIDPISYDVFPNIHLWGGLAQKIVYRFRPDGTSPDRTLMEMFLFKLPPAGEKPPPASLTMLSETQTWADATELGYLGGIIAQDDANLGPVQKGLKDLADREIYFGRYSEVRLRNLHRMIDVYINRD